MIEIENVNKRYQSRGSSDYVQALADVNLRINAGEFVTLLGPSGCGKTTLLKCVAGLLPWDSGTIQVAGKRVSGPGPERAFVFQNFALLPWRSVIDNVSFGLELADVSKKERRERAQALVETVGLSGFEHRWPHELSGGMQQRVGLARALAVDPDVLLMDEPFGALDEQTRRLLQEELLDIWERTRKTVVFVTHSMDEAVRLGDRVVLMSPRPGSIDEIIDVPLARPRTEETLVSAEFRETATMLWHKLRDMHQTGRVPASD
jgi:NitT/TauT family transport system ATP-binding protein